MRLWIQCLIFSVAASSYVTANPLTQRHSEYKLKKAALTEGEEDLRSYRLPNNTIPLKYDVQISTNIHRGDPEFRGTVKIEIAVIAKTNKIVLQLRQLTIVDVKLYGSKNILSNEIGIVSRQQVDDLEFLEITASREFEIGEKPMLVITYVGQLRDDNLGFYRSSYIDSEGKTVWMASTQFEPTDARHAFPCYDEPQIRAPFVIKIEHDSSYNAISNWPEKSRFAIPGTSFVLTEFEETAPVQTYLIAFIISPFTSTGDLNSVPPQRVFAKPEFIENHQADVALFHGVQLLEKYEEHFGVPFDPPKLDQVAIPDFDAGAMENWGLVTYREEYLLFDVRTSTTRDHENVLTVISHEYAHMWFGDHVNPIWWDFLWLNEGFATVYEYFMTSLVFPRDRLMDEFVTSVVQNALEVDADPKIRPMTHYVESPEKISALFDSIAYDKSGSVLRMMQNVFGDEVWTKGLRYYLNEKNMSAVSSADLHTALQTAYDEEFSDPLDISKVMFSWEDQAGCPLVNVKRTGNQLTLTQERFFYEETESSNLWWIPINFVTESTSSSFDKVDADYWIPGERQLSISLNQEIANDEWIIVNKQQGFYYRVNYDENLWNSIIKQLRDGNHEKIHLLSRAQLIDDSLNLARAGKISYRIPLEILEHLVNETDYIPWASASRGLSLLDKWLSGTTAYESYQSFVRRIVDPLFGKFGVDIELSEPKLDRFARQIAINLACIAGHQTCLSNSSQKLDDMLTNGLEIMPDVQSSIYCNGLRGSNSTMFLHMQERMLKSEVQAERTLIIGALGCVEDESTLIHYLGLAINGKSLRLQEKSRILTAPVNSGIIGLRAMIKFIILNHEDLSSSQINMMLSTIASRISTEAIYNEFESLLTLLTLNNGISEGTQTSLKTAANAGLNWQKKHLKEIEMWLEANEEATTTEAAPTTQGSQSIFASTLLIITCAVMKYLL